ncbi:MAG: hypothetical protein JWQ77_373 [Jatrophihabitans sp.]|nr:hypothetical protein [Jatrophihabitans sp.]
MHGAVVATGEVADFGTLHLDDPSAEISELAAGERPGDGLLQGYDHDAVERLWLLGCHWAAR